MEIAAASTDEDVAFIAARFEETIALWEEYQVTPEKIAEREQGVRKWLQDPKGYLSVARVDGRVVGFNSAVLVSWYGGQTYGKIVILYVLPEMRGQGIARALKLDGERWLREHGVTKVITEIDARNERMLAINEKAGFRVRSITFEKELS